MLRYRAACDGSTVSARAQHEKQQILRGGQTRCEENIHRVDHVPCQGIIYTPLLGWYTPLLTLTHTPKLCSPIGGVYTVLVVYSYTA